MGMYEPLRLVSDTYPGVVPKVRVQGLMAVFIAVSILWAFLWLTYRAYQVCQTPNDILVDKLGLDIPPVPEVTLEEIGAREIRIAWKYSESQNSILKHVIQLNGIRVGESKRSETAATILNLLPGHIYHICVVAVSATNFQTSSTIIHIRTKPDSPQDQGSDTVGEPTVQAYAPRSPPLVSPPAPSMSREHSGGQVQGKRASGGRKLTLVTSGSDITPHSPVDDGKGSGSGESERTLAQLAERLKGLQQENESLDKQLCQEEKEYETLLRELEEQRNDLRQRVKEKDEASGDLRKQVNKLESVNRSAQNERSKRERLLQQKDAERKKRNEDMVRWDQQIIEMGKEIEKLEAEKTRVEEETTNRVEGYRSKILAEQAEMKSLDDDIKIKGSRIKVLEEERRRLEGGDDEEMNEMDQLERDRERRWDIKMANLRAQYTSLINVHTQAQQQYYEAQERLKWVTSQRPNNTIPYVPPPALNLDPMRRSSGHRGSRHRNSLTSNVSSPVGFPILDIPFGGPSNYSQVATGSPTFPTSSAFFNINNGMTIPDPSEQTSPVRAETSNPPMSPRADALLPSDLLGDEEQPPTSRPSSSSQFPSLGPSAAPFDNIVPKSPSPVSSGSRPTSIFVSPHESLSNLNESDIKSGKTVKRPLTQGPSDGIQSASRRLSGLFGFNRQRGKTVADGAPVLGSLKQGQSQSFPRNLDDLDPIGTRRRRSSYTGNWANPMTTLFPRNTLTADSSSDRLPSGRKAMFPSFFTSGRFGSAFSLDKSPLERSETGVGYNQFSPRHDPIDPSILGTVRRDSLSPRPASTYSFDNLLPRPTAENQPFGWPAPDVPGHRTNPLGVDWSSPTPWSRSQSRRPSIQLGSSNHLPLALPTDMEFLDTPYELQRPVQAPIGTRPSSSHRPITPKLNPAAPSFKTLFSKKSEKSKGKESKEGDSSKTHDDPYLDQISPESRRSKDARSIHTSAAESHESLDRVSSSTPSEAISAKESFIQKITRKGSSSKFNMPWKDRAGIFSKKGDQSAHGEGEDEGSEVYLGKSFESVISSTPSVEKSSKSSLGFGFIRKSKKSDKTASEASEKASETGDEELSEDA